MSTKQKRWQTNFECWELPDRTYIISSQRRGEWSASVRFPHGHPKHSEFKTFGFWKFTSRKAAIQRCERHLKNGR